ncbi:hypothetical protein IW261DRAFT_1568026 [Armillaria novae-zelandiae]|uniref:Uncharacterized protein n=1 Tax=Armillaria novae-zelandiae TaxID=153914 RepID=A0AA39UAC5_9AGAR|nr:hypothetical protein IW261DRAFT_1568026 [Armillaria novae-zelandiae]
MSRTTCTSSIHATSLSLIPTIPDENDEHTLTGFGDISLSDDCFIPGIASDISATKTESLKRPKKPPALCPRPSVLSNRPPPPLMAKALRSPTENQRLIKAALAEPKVNFKTLIDSVRLIEQKIPPQKSPQKKGIPSPIAIFKRGVASSPPPSPWTPVTSPKTPKTPKPVTPRTPKSPSSPQSPKPWRGNSPLPKRPPLPIWDLVYPELANGEEENQEERHQGKSQRKKTA